MRVTPDLNVILDVVQHRQPHYPHSARVLHLARTRQIEAVFRRARQLGMADVEDAVVAAVAEATQSAWIVTRNIADFAASPVSARTPADFLNLPETVNLPPATERP